MGALAQVNQHATPERRRLVSDFQALLFPFLPLRASTDRGVAIALSDRAMADKSKPLLPFCFLEQYGSSVVTLPVPQVWTLQGAPAFFP